MRLIKPKAELLIQGPGLEGVYKQIELAGRTCYKSEDKITEGSAKPFVGKMIASNHTAMLEHGTVYLFIPEEEYDAQLTLLSYAVKKCEKYGRVFFGEDGVYVTTNFRVLHEHKLDWAFEKYICDPTEHHERRYTFRMTTSIGVTRELNRHRVNSIAEQSTRYCNYSKDKFGGEVTFMTPVWCPDYDETDWDSFLHALYNAEKSYLSLLEQGWQPQQAREVLPLCTATEIVHTAFASDWRHFFDLRYFEKTGKPHPNMKQLSTLMKAEAEKYGIWDDVMKQPSKFE